ncbi:F-box protein PP2-B10-like [Cornus florida]|uniref:F-box protein PP2-B10-like n=1 Tax=Cornus florida TaxID=4283 RepID=UPI0028A23ED2|nr:F-box protein PP2-B10-like [Cornus florida]
MVDFSVLPEDCVTKVLSFTTPRDVCRLTLVASTVMYTADSDPVWETFLPEDYHDIVSQFQLVFSSKKELYFQLCNRPLLIDGGTKSFWLEKWSGKKCYMLAARDLYIIWGDTPLYWRWDSSSRARESRFREVAELVSVCWLEIRGKIDTCMLSPDTTYAAYLVFKSTSAMYGFEYQPVEGWVAVGGNKSETRTVYLDPAPEERQQFHIVLRQAGMLRYPTTGMVGRQASPPRENPPCRESNAQYPKERGDGWFEIEFGELYNKSGEDGELELCLQEVKSGSWKSGLILEGIEIRPKEGN